MTESRVRVGVLFGGESAEHEVSLESARNVIKAIDRDRYEVVAIGIDRQGRWYRADERSFLARSSNYREGYSKPAGEPALAVAPGQGVNRLSLDVVFPVLHGPRGEDGTVQGLLRLAHLPFVGAGVVGSAVGMDKDVCKRLLRDAGIPVAPFLTVRRRDEVPLWADAAAALGSPVFVKPANMGSSIGIARAASAGEYERALDEAFSFDFKVLLERSVRGRELEVSVLGNDDPAASLPGEIVPRHDFYTYKAKYLDDAGADLLVPAELDPVTVAQAQELAVRTFRALCCEGMARVDLFLATEDSGAVRAGELLVNEINTIPGFTKISMYPKLWEASGVTYAELVNRLIELALERAEKEGGLASAFESEDAT